MAPTGKGEWLVQQMDRRRIGVRQVADALGVTTKTVYDWRNGVTAISEERVPRLAEVLGFSELEARRGLGFWVPTETESEAEPNTESLDEIRDLLRDALARLDSIERERGAS